MCEVASSSGLQSMALVKVGCYAYGNFHCFSLILPQVHNVLGLVSGLDGKSPILLYLILYHILVVLSVLGSSKYRTTFHCNNTRWLYVPSLNIVLVSPLFVSCKVLQFFDSTKQLQMLCEEKIIHDSCLSKRKT
jgi:hypothetical protein